MFQVRRLQELDPVTVYQILRARSQVFVEEQKIDYCDPDDQDLTAWHLFEKADDGEVIAYARIFQVDYHVTFGRVLTSATVRGTGKGRELLTAILEFCHAHFSGLPITINAQLQAVGYYEKQGFVVAGTPFLEVEIPHVRMTYRGE
ncbi:GNAT family N-acetyltransferase [Fructilactobacillus myrtifloralis]|uniref:GNAT family N-acetyltransferase n=1 Tax=Fructilactobacillus myrtifloralis TaxID=2940301 RepID=A0ABY5BQA2_9LACO|nr:GNAT family N-acetyltransferase [Fructilactobacillus myrtifloralis]USS84594.1 GNAT family N-acetyltransferase [Fructilactobacillus myrtifloralis]